MTSSFIDECIRKARNHESCLDAGVLSIRGFSTGVMRRLVSNICEAAKVYCEVGAYCGGTACAAINNKPVEAFIFEDFSQSFGYDSVRLELEATLAKYGNGKERLILKNYVTALDEITAPVDVYFYDGEHSRESQAEALPAMLPALSPKFIFMVDDAGWDTVSLGTKDGFERLGGKVEILSEWKLRGLRANDDKIWHNGVDLYLCAKK